jgi:hypothetical protein
MGLWEVEAALSYTIGSQMAVVLSALHADHA